MTNLKRDREYEKLLEWVYLSPITQSIIIKWELAKREIGTQSSYTSNMSNPWIWKDL